MNEKFRRTVVFCLALLVVGLGWRSSNLAGRLELERAEHDKTRLELVQAVAEARRWRQVADENLVAAEAQKSAVEACLAREVEARADEKARKAILAPVKPRPRLPEDREKVVDDETRARVADRLNRPL